MALSWAKRLLAAVAFSLAALAPLPAQAASSSPTQVDMTGQLQVGGTRRAPQFLLSAAAADASGWQLKATVVPSSARGSSDANLTGRYTMAAAGTPILEGDASGTVNLSSGDGSLDLALPDGSTASVTFSVAQDGSLQLTVAGDLPAPITQATTTQDNPLFWELSRTTGMVAYLLLFANVCLGLSVRTNFLSESVPRWRAFDLHRLTALMATALVAAHVFTLLGDHFIGFTLPQLLLPGASSYRQLPVAAGIVGFYTLLIVVGSFYVRRFTGNRFWRKLHYVTFALFFLALVHGIFAGSDNEAWAKLIYWCTGAGAALLAIARFWGPWSHRARQTIVTPTYSGGALG
ncbi:MAG: ferric reductase-like transmembrane domain-containing protein [Chloroflexi bacterium]|nr:ferric reductase-like transmembrane domain-containing protein [Chloroflexota bacterium]